MENGLKEKIAANSSMLPRLLSDLTQENIEWCANILNDENIQLFLKDEELIKTAEIFFQNNLNISKTSANGFMHRNTLLYRIEKIEKMTGLDIRKFEDAVTMNIILILNNQRNMRKRKRVKKI